jgi:hypothetical protein
MTERRFPPPWSIEETGAGKHRQGKRQPNGHNGIHNYLPQVRPLGDRENANGRLPVFL